MVGTLRNGYLRTLYPGYLRIPDLGDDTKGKGLQSKCLRQGVRDARVAHLWVKGFGMQTFGWGNSCGVCLRYTAILLTNQD